MGFLEDAGNFFGDVVAVPLGGVGAIAGGVTGLATGGGLSGFEQGWTAGASFSPAGRLGTEARARVRRTYERFEANSNLAGPLKGALTALGPPTTATESWLILGGSAVGGGLAARAATKAGAATAGPLSRFFGRQAVREVAVVGGLGAGARAIMDRLQPAVPGSAPRGWNAAAAPPASPRVGVRSLLLPGVLVGGALLALVVATRR